MNGALFHLAGRVGLLPLIFKETDGGFYTAAADIPLKKEDGLTVKRDGRFTFFIPGDGWYLSEAERIINCRRGGALFNEDNDRLIKLFAGYMFSKSQAGDELLLNGEAKKMLLSAAFFEADLIRAKMRGDSSVILRRADKTLGLYYAYYYSGSIEKKSTGYISRAAGEFFSSALSSLGFDFDNVDFNIK